MENNDKNGFNKYEVEIFKKLCSYVNLNYDEVDFTKEGWYQLTTWTNEQEIDFEEWLFKYLKRRPSARKSLLNIPNADDKTLKDAIEYFVFDYGWSTTNEPIYIKRTKESANKRKTSHD